ncbi:MAG: hypothetical protein NTW48_01005 [Chloroflexi bacterium]|nr:hypothetical protein [Chloroflexota bacterium]
MKKAKFWVILLLLVATTLVACQKPETSTLVAKFTTQMRYLKEAGFTVVLLPDVF